MKVLRERSSPSVVAEPPLSRSQDREKERFCPEEDESEGCSSTCSSGDEVNLLVEDNQADSFNKLALAIEKQPLHCQPEGVTSAEAPLGKDQVLALACLSELLSILGLDCCEADRFGQSEVNTAKDNVQPENWPSQLCCDVSNSSPEQPAHSRTRKDKPRRRIFDQSAFPTSSRVDTVRRETTLSMFDTRLAPLLSPKTPKMASCFYPRPPPGKSLLKRSDSGSTVGSGSIKRNNSNVSFSNLEIREYGLAISDHPDCSYGAGIQLDWVYSEQAPVSVDDYEEQRSPRNRGSQLLVPYLARKHLLLNQAGYSHEDLQWAIREVYRVKRERSFTAESSKDLTSGMGSVLNGLHSWFVTTDEDSKFDGP